MTRTADYRRNRSRVHSKQSAQRPAPR